ncbi:uncharacterized protein N7484_006611 [Penicillium longicatenatum]|uniref:uncharacterized protein n=1 Tax=Penicillium longicatenatum TaxID=1561947 RepID=UPI002546AF5A|nr:uncharacterized protein N7484_006611 [Penicillium longicatenatum]KAJ5644104.1 hypothetical protein N7484_006611 [Penicillium longicatenatum]
MSTRHAAQDRSRLIQEAIDNLFAEFGATVGNLDRTAQNLHQAEENYVFQVLRDYENGTFPNGRVILAHDGEFIVLKSHEDPSLLTQQALSQRTKSTPRIY